MWPLPSASIKRKMRKDLKVAASAAATVAAVLPSLAHAAVVKLREVVVGDELGAVFLVFEYVEHDLASLLTHGHPFSTAEVKGVCAQLCEGLAYLPKFGLLSNYIHVTV